MRQLQTGAGGGGTRAAGATIGADLAGGLGLGGSGVGAVGPDGVLGAQGGGEEFQSWGSLG